MKDVWDIERPVLKEGEVLCSGCWKVSPVENTIDKWKIYTFKYLSPVVLCQECQLREQRDVKVKQDYGL